MVKLITLKTHACRALPAQAKSELRDYGDATGHIGAGLPVRLHGLLPFAGRGSAVSGRAADLAGGRWTDELGTCAGLDS